MEACHRGPSTTGSNSDKLGRVAIRTGRFQFPRIEAWLVFISFQLDLPSRVFALGTFLARHPLLSSSRVQVGQPPWCMLLTSARSAANSISHLFKSTARTPSLLSRSPLHLRYTMSAASSAPKVPDTAPAKWPAPEEWPAQKVRQTFIDYFANTPGFEHTFWPSSGVIPFDDDTLLFANAVCPDAVRKLLCWR